jgi:mycothiol S-conjugate amidase
MLQYSELAALGITSHTLRATPARHALLVVYAHPDDESFTSAGTLLHCAEAGAAVHLVCATRGECGVAGADAAAVRTGELMCAATALGVTSVHLLGHRDSGMAGAPENNHPQALCRAPIAYVAAQLVALISVLRPHTVLTFGPGGGYGHPDHLAIHHATLAAFAASMPAWRPQRLYYATFSRRFLAIAIAGILARGDDPRRFGANRDLDMLRIAADATPVTTTIDGSRWYTRKRAAWECHASQRAAGPLGELLPERVRARLFRNEHLTRVIPPWKGGPRERSLFGE